jgi:hypothetical protein
VGVPWGEPAAAPDAEVKRHADCYVFCIHTEKDAATANALDLSKWQFLVISKKKLDQIFGDQKSVSCSEREKHCVETSFDELRIEVLACISS